MNIDPTFLAWLVPVVVALVEAAKRAVGLSSRILPLVALAAALVVAGVAVLADPPEVVTFWQGVGYWLLHALLGGISASGLYSLAAKPALSGLKKLAAQ